MKNLFGMTLLTLVTLNATAADFRDNLLGVSTKGGESVTKSLNGTSDKVFKFADMTAQELRDFLSKHLQSSFEASGKIGEAILKVSEMSEPVIQLTGDGIALVFETSEKTGAQTLKASEKLVLLLEPSSEISSEALGELLLKMSDGSESASELVSKILELLGEVLEKPFDITNMTLEELAKILTNGSEASTKVLNTILGAENLEKGVDLSSEGISLTSRGISGAFYLVSKGSEAVMNFFGVYREEIQKDLENGNLNNIAGYRAFIRNEIAANIVGGETLNQLLTDEDLDLFMAIQVNGML